MRLGNQKVVYVIVVFIFLSAYGFVEFEDRRDAEVSKNKGFGPNLV